MTIKRTIGLIARLRNSSGEEDFQILSMYYYLPLEKGMALLLNKFESPSPMDVLCQVCLKSCGTGEDNFKILSMYFHCDLHLEKGMAHHLNKLEFPLPKDALCQFWLKLAQ